MFNYDQEPMDVAADIGFDKIGDIIQSHFKVGQINLIGVVKKEIREAIKISIAHYVLDCDVREKRTN